jgi:ribonuclease PH
MVNREELMEIRRIIAEIDRTMVMLETAKRGSIKVRNPITDEDIPVTIPQNVINTLESKLANAVAELKSRVEKLTM